jgi:hypothetical protein
MPDFAHFCSNVARFRLPLLDLARGSPRLNFITPALCYSPASDSCSRFPSTSLDFARFHSFLLDFARSRLTLLNFTHPARLRSIRSTLLVLARFPQVLLTSNPPCLPSLDPVRFGPWITRRSIWPDHICTGLFWLDLVILWAL